MEFFAKTYIEIEDSARSYLVEHIASLYIQESERELTNKTWDEKYLEWNTDTAWGHIKEDVRHNGCQPQGQEIKKQIFLILFNFPLQPGQFTREFGLHQAWAKLHGQKVVHRGAG